MPWNFCPPVSPVWAWRRTLFTDIISRYSYLSIYNSRESGRGGKPLEIPVFDFVASRLEVYLVHARPILLAATIKEGYVTEEFRTQRTRPAMSVEQTKFFSSLVGPLWVSYFGRPLNYLGLHHITTSRGQECIGIFITSHMCRNAVSTTAAWNCGAHPHLGSTLLQHGSQAMTDHYDRSSAYEASKAYGQMLRKRRSCGPAVDSARMAIPAPSIKIQLVRINLTQIVASDQDANKSH